MDDDTFICHATRGLTQFTQKSLGRIGLGRQIPNRVYNNLPPHYGLAVN